MSFPREILIWCDCVRNKNVPRRVNPFWCIWSILQSGIHVYRLTLINAYHVMDDMSNIKTIKHIKVLLQLFVGAANLGEHYYQHSPSSVLCHALVAVKLSNFNFIEIEVMV